MTAARADLPARPFGAVTPGPEPSRARYPDDEGFVERDGVRVFWEVYGEGRPTILLLPYWSIVHSRAWRMQIPYLARRYRVLTVDGRGNGRSDRPSGSAAYSTTEWVRDALAVLDATGTDRAVLIGKSMGAQWELALAAEHPERVEAAIFVAPALPSRGWPALDELRASFDDPAAAETKWNAHYWRRDYRGFLEMFFGLALIEPHSTKLLEDGVRWGLETDPETLADSFRADQLLDPERIRELGGRIRCPALVIHGDRDLICPFEWGEALAQRIGAELVTFEGVSHATNSRHPVRFNLAVRDFVERELVGRARGQEVAT